MPIQPQASTPARRSRPGGVFVALYLGIVVAAFALDRAWLDEVATIMVATLLFWPGLRRGHVAAVAIWAAVVLLVGALAFAGHGKVALDFLPVVVNAAFCVLFAHTLARGRTPLIARVIAVVESPARVALPRVAAYARGLTLAWAILLGTQATVLAVLIACAMPNGALASFGIAPPFAVAGDAWRRYLHFGSYAVVLVFFAIEYAYRRWHLREIEHVPAPQFAARLAQRWPAVARTVMDDDA
ncbi:MAG: hypothetical protein ABW186_18140 [Rhodanobacteraceae bacterium]